MRRLINWLGDLLREIDAEEVPRPGIRELTEKPAPRWLVRFNWVLVGFVLGMFLSMVISQVCIWLSRP